MLSKKRSSILVPEDIVFEILLRLPIKSIGRFKFISKQWRSIIDHPRFESSHFARSSVQPKLLISLPDIRTCFSPSAGVFLFSATKTSPSSVEVSFQYRVSMAPSHKTPHSAGGIVCIQESNTRIKFCNPVTGECITIRTPGGTKEANASLCFFGYHPVTKEHKIIYATFESNNFKDPLATMHILTLGEEEEWRVASADGLLANKLSIKRCSVCIEGIMYMVGVSQKEAYLVSFDISSESFQVIPLPAKFEYYTHLIELRGRVAIVSSPLIDNGIVLPKVIDESDKEIRVWILEQEDEVMKWTRKTFSLASHLREDELLEEYYYSVGVTNKGEVGFVPNSDLSPPDYLYLYHLEHLEEEEELRLRQYDIYGDGYRGGGGLRIPVFGKRMHHILNMDYHIQRLQSLQHYFRRGSNPLLLES